MNETQITIRGWVGTEPHCKEVRQGLHVTEFRLATTPRKLNAETGEWFDGETLWVTVKAWRGLAENVAESVRLKQPVIVQGRLEAEVWERDGRAQTSYSIIANTVGHDLSHGRALFQRPARPHAEERPARSEDVFAEPPSGASAESSDSASLDGVEDPNAWKVPTEPAA